MKIDFYEFFNYIIIIVVRVYVAAVKYHLWELYTCTGRKNNIGKKKWWLYKDRFNDFIATGVLMETAVRPELSSGLFFSNIFGIVTIGG